MADDVGVFTWYGGTVYMYLCFDYKERERELVDFVSFSARIFCEHLTLFSTLTLPS